MKHLIYICLAAVLAFTSVTGCTTTKQITQASSPVAPGTSVKEIRQAIVEAANIRGWSLQENGANSFLANHSRGQYSATVQIDYTSTNYVISYVSSTGFKHGNGKIDKHYNDWVINLDKEISSSINKQHNLRLNKTK
ncbi:MAG: hypothetical protein K6F05_09035 [Succinivibrio sp.]|nr:hypothetical protein [Succinivibrio sp.]